MKAIRLPWGKEEIKVTLPAEWQFRREIVPVPVCAVADEEQEISTALRQPAGSLPLSEMSLAGKKVLIVIDDITRPTPVKKIMRAVWREMAQASISPREAEVLVALGMHRPMTAEEIKLRLGLDDLSAISVVNHDCFNASELTELGFTSGGSRILVNRRVAEADLVILVGTIEPHLLAGFGGGLKNIIPGCAGMETIAATHLVGAAAERFSSVGRMGEECLARRELEEAALKIRGRYFMVNTVLTAEGGIAGVFCGDPVKAHRNGCRLAAKVYGAPVPEQYDVLLLGSHPMDIDFRQGTKCLGNSLAAAREGALLIGFLRCERGLGDMTIPAAFLPPFLTGRFARELGTEKLVAIRNELAGPLNMDEIYMLQFLCEIARRFTVLIYAPALPAELMGRFGAFEHFSDLDKLLTRAKQLAPGRCAVASLPYGGIHYPVFAGENDSLWKEENRCS